MDPQSSECLTLGRRLMFDDRLINKRAHSVGHLSQSINSLTLYLAKRRGGVRGAPSPPGTIAA
jgi:hypothetical protein